MRQSVRRWSAGVVIKAILAGQIALAALLVAGDLHLVWPRPAPPAPQLDAPIRPGDQTRRYRLPSRPGRTPLPARGELPDRLAFTPLAEAGWALRGTVAPGDAARIVPSIEREAPRRISLNSPGGSVEDALQIGRAIRAAGAETAVEAAAICLSACPYLLAAGVERSVAEGAAVGVHQHYFGESSVLPAFLAVEDVQRGQAQVMSYLAEMGVDPLLMRHALATAPDKIYLLVAEELQRYRLVGGNE